MAAKQPQDHKTPKNQPKTVEVMGVTVTVGPAIFNDLDMVEYLYDLQYTAMKDALRDPDTGRVSIDKVSDFIAQLLEQVAPNS